jgi:rhodanese-related sulfurtransferase
MPWPSHASGETKVAFIKSKTLAVLSVLFLAAVFGTVRASDEAFPHRAKFKNVPVMEAEALRKDLGKVLVVDVRSHYEYETLHIKGALHIALNKDKLPLEVKALRAKSDVPIVFYCNGHTCKKSYEAAEFAKNAGVSNVFAFDAGIDTWAKLYPEQSVLLGKSPVQPGEFISSTEFKKHLINVQNFEVLVEKGAVVLDIRDLRQRDVVLFPMRELRAPLDDSHKIADAVAQAKKAKKTLLVYDKVGKQTRWFQYYLEQQGVKDYYFLEGGSEGYYEAKFGKPQFTVPEQS